MQDTFFVILHALLAAVVAPVVVVAVVAVALVHVVCEREYVTPFPRLFSDPCHADFYFFFSLFFIFSLFR